MLLLVYLLCNISVNFSSKLMGKLLYKLTEELAGKLTEELDNNLCEELS